MSSKPLLIFSGNCQAQHLAAILETTDLADTVYFGRDFGFLPSFEGNPCNVCSEADLPGLIADARENRRAVIRCLQTSPMAKIPDDAAEGMDHLVLFPELRFYTLAPETFKKRFGAEHASTARIYKFDIQNTKLSQKKAGFANDIAGLIEENAPKRILFHTTAHPTGELMAQLVDGIVQQLSGYFDVRQFQTLVERLANTEGLNFITHHPVSPVVLEELKFNWGLEYSSYASMIAAQKNRAWLRYGLRRRRYKKLFSNDTQFWNTEALFLIGRKKHEDALTVLENLLLRSPGAPKYWKLYSETLLRLIKKGKRDGKHTSDLTGRAEKFFGQTNTANLVIGNVHQTHGHFSEAEERYKEYFNRAQKTMRSIGELRSTEPLLRMYARQGKLPAIKTFVETHSQHSRFAKTHFEKLLRELKLTQLLDG